MATLLSHPRHRKPARGNLAVASLLHQTCPWKPCCGKLRRVRRPCLSQNRCENRCGNRFSPVTSLLWQTCPWKPCYSNLAIKNLPVEILLRQAFCSKPAHGNLVVASLLYQTCPWKPCYGRAVFPLSQACCGKPARGNLVVAALL